MVPQTTLARSSSRVTGRQLDREAQASVRFHPAPAGTGVVFTRQDLAGEPSVLCCVQHVKVLPRWSTLECDGTEVHHTEHILAALAGYGVDNVRVELDGDRIPVVSGGSCLEFSRALAAAGLKDLERPRSVYRLKRPIELETNLDVPAGTERSVPVAKRSVVGVPSDGFAASYLFHVPTVPGLRTGFAEFVQGRDLFEEGPGSARTYYLRTEESAVSGLLSSARHDYIVLDSQSPQEHVDEVARHKLVDFWGDLLLLGKPVCGRFAAVRTGHRFHHDLIRTLADGDYLETFEIS